MKEKNKVKRKRKVKRNEERKNIGLFNEKNLPSMLGISAER